MFIHVRPRSWWNLSIDTIILSRVVLLREKPFLVVSKNADVLYLRRTIRAQEEDAREKRDATGTVLERGDGASLVARAGGRRCRCLEVGGRRRRRRVGQAPSTPFLCITCQCAATAICFKLLLYAQICFDIS
jgi:hypothetical protein